jgi:uncharacterized membrane-anchored protein YhcB (DUF1043 family)
VDSDFAQGLIVGILIGMVIVWIIRRNRNA